MTNAADDIYLGLISGTSVDAIDAALVTFGPTPKLIAAIAHPYPTELRQQILQLGLGDGATHFRELGALDVQIGRAFADAANALLRSSAISAKNVRAIGSHGQTLWHAPREPVPFTLQLGDPNTIAERTGITTVADFRRRDMAAGGEGAPLVPAFHAACLRCESENRAILNLGGIANLTLLPMQGDVSGFDTGPANTLMDLWCEAHGHGSVDIDGAFAARGRSNNTLLARLLSDPYFAAPAPKSTGRDYFNLGWLQQHLSGANAQPVDVQATLLLLSARSIAQALQTQPTRFERLLVCGGGVHNRLLMQALKAELPDVVVETTHQHGLDADYVEAMAFAWLARQTLRGLPGNLADVTGARGPRVLGGIYPA